MVAFGMMMAFVFSVTFLPAAMALLPVRVKAKPKSKRAPMMDRLASFVIARRRVLLYGTLGGHLTGSRAQQGDCRPPGCSRSCCCEPSS